MNYLKLLLSLLHLSNVHSPSPGTGIKRAEPCLKVPTYTAPTTVIEPTRVTFLDQCCDVSPELISRDRADLNAASKNPTDACFRQNPAGFWAPPEQICNAYTTGGYPALETFFPPACAPIDGSNTKIPPFSPITLSPTVPATSTIRPSSSRVLSSMPTATSSSGARRSAPRLWG